jgi:activator of HSP90 ATPase
MTTKNTTMTKKITSTPEAWEDRLLGADEEYAVAVPAEDDAQLDEVLALRMISIRLPESLIEDFKNIATISCGAMRQVLKRFATSELKMIARDMADQMQKSKAQATAKTGTAMKWHRAVANTGATRNSSKTSAASSSQQQMRKAA